MHNALMGAVSFSPVTWRVWLPMVNYNKRKPICGFGINDAEYVVVVSKTVGWVEGRQITKLVWKCPFYSVWKSMIERCYSEKYLKKKPSYVGCSVCEVSPFFTNFKTWMETQSWEGRQLDKDLLVQGNKIYSPDTCCFISSQINSFMTEANSARGEYPIGVSFVKRTGMFSACCRNGSGILKSLGYYDTPEEAHSAWLLYKQSLAKSLAANETDARIAEALINRYEKYGTV